MKDDVRREPQRGGTRRWRRPNVLMTIVLDVVYFLIAVVSLLVAVLRGRFAKTRDHLRRRLFEGPPARDGDRPCLWVHGVSVGEVLTVQRLVERLAEEYEGWDVVVSASTAAGVDAARKQFPDHLVFSAPLDAGFAVHRAYRRLRPDALIIVEHDIWPNLLRFACANGVPVALVNARLSPESLAGYRRLSMVFRWPPRSLALLCVQDEASAEGFRSLGYSDDRIAICGNLKFDNPPPKAGELRREIGFEDDDYVLVAGSTHSPEEEVMLEAFAKLREARERVYLILVPRRIERTGAIEELARAESLTVERWSRSRARGPDVIIVDTIGDLAKLCAAADLVFVGGTIAPIGGHNVIEPANFSKPIVIGPHYKSQKSIVTSFLDAGALVVCEDSATLVAQIVELAADVDRSKALGERARRVVDANAGSGDATMRALRSLLESAQSR